MNPDSIRKANDSIFGGFFVKKFMEQYGNTVTEEEKRKVFIETQKYRDIVAQYRQLMREQSRAESMEEIIEQAFKARVDKPCVKYDVKCEELNKECEVVVAFADPHYGADFKVVGFNNEVFNEYNPKVVKQRFNILSDEIISFCKVNGTNKISLVDLGDSVEGILHLSQLKAMKTDVVDDIIDYSDLIVGFVTTLANEGLIIDMYTSQGNHSDCRLLTGKKGDFPHENLEKIYFRWVSKFTKDNPNIMLHPNLNGLNYFDVKGYKFMSAHGQNEKNVLNSIKDYEDTYKIAINYFLVGHLHCKNEVEVTSDKEVVQVRSMMGVNDYSQTIKKTSSAGATMFTVERGYGKHYVNEVKFK